MKGSEGQLETVVVVKGQWLKENPKGQNFKQYNWLSTTYGGEVPKNMDLYLFMDNFQ